MSRIITVIALFGLLCLDSSVFAEEGSTQPVYHELSPSLITNLPSGAKYIRCDVQLMTLDPERLPDIQLHAPAIRHALLMLLSDQDGAKLQTAEGKTALLEQSLERAREVMQDQTGKGSIDDVFFTAYFVQ